MTAKAKVLVIALDAAEPSLIKKWAASGELPTFQRMMEEGIIGAVFDYALGEVSDEMFDGLRAGGPERLTVAGRLGLPQVICPGGAEQVTNHGFGRTHRNLRVLAKNGFDALGLGDIAKRCRCAMGINVIHPVRCQSGIIQGRSHA